LDAAVQREICEQRRLLARGPAYLGWKLHISPSTVYLVLRRAGLNRLDRLDRLTRTIVRYEHEQPGDLLHMDVKKLWRIPPGGGRHFELTAEGGETISRQGKRGHGYDCLHVAIDDHSRYLYAELLPDQKASTTTTFLSRALQHLATLDVKVRRVLTDNGMNYRSKELRRFARKQHIKLKRTRPYRPQTNGKAERVIQTLLREWAYLRPYIDNDERSYALPLYLVAYNTQRPHSALAGLPPITRICKQPL
jgi:transposase InsO family protein